MNAEVNIDLVLSFDCPHCNKSQNTSDHDDLLTSISTGSQEIECIECKEPFDLNIREHY